MVMLGPRKVEFPSSKLGKFNSSHDLYNQKNYKALNE